LSYSHRVLAIITTRTEYRACRLGPAAFVLRTRSFGTGVPQDDGGARD